MISLDTNALIRLITRDDKDQTLKVEKLLTQLEAESQQAFVPSLVMLEVIWVLSFSFKVTRSNIIQTILELLEVPVLKIEHNEQLKNLLLFAKHNTFDLSDLMVVYRCQSEEALPVMTFDKRASKHESFELIR